MSRTRKLKKPHRVVEIHYTCHDGITEVTEHVYGPSQIRYAVNYEKRRARDPFFLVAQNTTGAPVKYARCEVCVGRPHHSPNVRKLDHLAWLTCEARDHAGTCTYFTDGVHRCCTVPFDDQHGGNPHRCACRHRWLERDDNAAVAP